jgi:hypothetical protein
MHAGSWSSAISRLAQLQPGNLRYFEIYSMSTSDMSVLDSLDPAVEWEEFLAVIKKPVEQWATCSVYLS